MAVDVSLSYGKVVCLLLESVADGPDPDNIPDLVAADLTPTLQRLTTNEVVPLATPSFGATTARLKTGTYQLGVMPDGHLTDDVDSLGGVLPDAVAGVWLAVGQWRITFGGGFKSQDFWVTSEHTEANPLDLGGDLGYVAPTGVTVRTVALPSGGQPGQVYGLNPDGSLGWYTPVAGDSAYQSAVKGGYSGTESEWLASLVGEAGASAYEIAVAGGFVGTEAQWVASLKGLKGDQGDVGPAPSLAIGAVTKLSAGSTPTASFTGTNPYTLNLGLPPGADGSPTPYELRGTGMPNGVVTASPGTYYTDTAGTNGAWRWLKKTGTGNTGWECIQGDTGWRKIYEGANVLEPSWNPGTVPSGGRLRIRRTANGLFVSADNITMATANSPLTLLGGLPSQWQVSADSATYPGAFYVLSGSQPVFRVDRGDLNGTHPGGMIRDIKFYPASTAWPTTLPGTA